MYTYVFAYYLKKNNQSIIFEDNQKDLEMATEELSGRSSSLPPRCLYPAAVHGLTRTSSYTPGYLEGEDIQKDPLNVKRAVMDKTEYCAKRRRVLLNHVYEEDEFWEYKPDSIQEMMSKLVGIH